MLRRSIVLVLSVLLAPVGVASAGTDAPVTPYNAPPFADECEFHRFAEGEVPDLTAYPDDPLCVEYAKRDITVDNGGAVAFALAEPARVALASGKCQYWQRDHWSVQFSRGDVPVIRWDGSYWFDKGSGRAGAILRHFKIDGRQTSSQQALQLIATASPTLATIMRSYGASANFGLPLDPRCPS